MIERLRRDFVPVAGNLRELQGPDTPVAHWFVAMARKLNYHVDMGEEAEGYYVFGPDGAPFAFTDWQSAEKVVETLDEGLSASRKHPSANPDFGGPSPRPKPPAETGTSVLRSYARIRPVPEGANPINRSIGRDHIWVYPEEIAALSAHQVGDAFDLPATFAARLARFHLIDNVRGEPDMWLPEEVRKASFQVHVLAREGSVLRFGLEGEFAQQNAAGNRGQSGTLAAEFAIDTAARRIVRFRGYSEGIAWGSAIGTKCTELAPPGKYPLIIALVETDDPVAQLVPPQAASLAGEYRKPRIGSR
ncbi:MAG: hypothetical protein M9921_11155 [Fimbriimonadaceae bacterium]|nr:hypothetical protein [Fimbriimonadaceae bacterium]